MADTIDRIAQIYAELANKEKISTGDKEKLKVAQKALREIYDDFTHLQECYIKANTEKSKYLFFIKEIFKVCEFRYDVQSMKIYVNQHKDCIDNITAFRFIVDIIHNLSIDEAINR